MVTKVQKFPKKLAEIYAAKHSHLHHRLTVETQSLWNLLMTTKIDRRCHSRRRTGIIRHYRLVYTYCQYRCFCERHLWFFYLKAHSYRAKVEAKAKIFFDVCRLFFDPSFPCSLIFFAFTPALAWYEKAVTCKQNHRSSLKSFLNSTKKLHWRYMQTKP